MTQIEKLNENFNNNKFYIKREDLLPFSFGGNKARKAQKFKEDIIKNKNDVVITYGSCSSNHCRIIANMASELGIKCYIISPNENYYETNNSKIIQKLGAEIIKVSLDEVKRKISELVNEISKTNNPYFIQGGGHGDLGTLAYVEAYEEIKEYEKKENITFDYIFFASGTGTTHAGLECGKINNNDFNKKIIGISVARNKEYGREIINNSINSFFKTEGIDYDITFLDEYVCGGYGKYNDDILNYIRKVMLKDGIMLNTVYTGKAYYGMIEYLKNKEIKNKNILFINTGGTPIFFDDLEVM